MRVRKTRLTPRFPEVRGQKPDWEKSAISPISFFKFHTMVRKNYTFVYLFKKVRL